MNFTHLFYQIMFFLGTQVKHIYFMSYDSFLKQIQGRFLCFTDLCTSADRKMGVAKNRYLKEGSTEKKRQVRLVS